MIVTSLMSSADLQDQLRRAAVIRRLGMNITQAELAARAGVPLSTLKRFEQKGEISLAALLRIADVLGALEGFGALFPPIVATTLDELEAAPRRQRARS